MKSKREADGDGCAVKTPEEKLQAEAESKRKQAAERQRSRRAGKKTYPVQLNKSDVEKPVSWGYVPACADDRDVGAAIAKIGGSCAIYYARPALPAETAVDLSRRAEGPRAAKGGFRRKREPRPDIDRGREGSRGRPDNGGGGTAKNCRGGSAKVEADWLTLAPRSPPACSHESIHERAARLERERKEVVAAYRAECRGPTPGTKGQGISAAGQIGHQQEGGQASNQWIWTSHQFPESQAGSGKADQDESPGRRTWRKVAKIMPPDDSVHTLQATNAELREMYSSRGSHERD